MRFVIFPLALFAGAGGAAADINLSIPLKGGSMDSVEAVTYACGDGDSLAVQYVNSGVNALAILPVDGEDRIFVNVLSGSGARYASGEYVWWTKGDSGTLENLQEADGKLDCTAE